MDFQRIACAAALCFALAPAAGCGGSARVGLAGKNFYATWDNGRKFLLEFGPDGKTQRYTGVVGKSNNETVDIETVAVAPDIYMVSWVESDGFTVTRVDNLATMTSQAYWSWDEKGRRVGKLHAGKLEPTTMTRERLFHENPALESNPPDPPR
ncbi:hypothetical protein LVJ94_21055 [Pendulispora rubella]|uniref:MoaF-like domain-containing protein n=1 Tax=Pendulispora rubella TaxID=2741070 RepID=A0ABZ2LKQ5_9BACT